jgi:hypothetical protein
MGLLVAAATVFALYAGVMIVLDTQSRTEAQARIQSAANAAAVGSASELPKGSVAVVQAACRLLASQQTGGSPLLGGQPEVQVGHWDPIAQAFTVCAAKPNAVRITIRLRSAPRLFASSPGLGEQQIEAQAIAVREPVGHSLVAQTLTQSTATR